MKQRQEKMVILKLQLYFKLFLDFDQVGKLIFPPDLLYLIYEGYWNEIERWLELQTVKRNTQIIQKNMEIEPN